MKEYAVRLFVVSVRSRQVDLLSVIYICTVQNCLMLVFPCVCLCTPACFKLQKSYVV